MLELGSCGLHNVHGGFKDAIKETEWQLVIYLRSLYNLFKDVLARRAKYTQYTESDVFPSKFCAIRWLENSDVAQRVIDIHENVKKFTEGVKIDQPIKIDVESTFCPWH